MAHEFKVDDKVRVIDHRPSDTHNFYWSPKMDKYLGKEGIVEAVLGNIMVKFPDGDWWLYKPSWLTPVESDSKPQFKPHDRVRVKPREWIDAHIDEPSHPSFVDGMKDLCGKEIEIISHDKFDDTYLANGYWWKAEWLEPIETETRPSLSRPFRAIVRDTVEALCGLSTLGQPKPSSDKLPLINKTKLLTHIKLD